MPLAFPTGFPAESVSGMDVGLEYEGSSKPLERETSCLGNRFAVGRSISFTAKVASFEAVEDGRFGKMSVVSDVSLFAAFQVLLVPVPPLAK
jgi:hypothetical protein